MQLPPATAHGQGHISDIRITEVRYYNDRFFRNAFRLSVACVLPPAAASPLSCERPSNSSRRAVAHTNQCLECNFHILHTKSAAVLSDLSWLAAVALLGGGRE